VGDGFHASTSNIANTIRTALYLLLAARVFNAVLVLTDVRASATDGGLRKTAYRR